MEPQLLKGGFTVDDRGNLDFVNSVDFSAVKRFYIVSNHAQGFIRAWHGHQHEGKFVIATAGASLVGAVQVDDWNNPDPKAEVHRIVLSEYQLSVLYIPAGYANGFKTLTPNAKLMFLSTSTLDESKGDDFRIPFDYWDIWKEDYR